MTVAVQRRRIGLPGPIARVASGIGAVGVKELRGRMRGRRAFVVLTVYLLLVGGFAWAIQAFLERTYAGSYGGFNYAAAEIGRGIFLALLLLETLLIVLLAPAFTAGSISLEREKQTFDLLTATPISSLGIVLGKLLSALVYVFLLIAASLPLTAIVFVYGGVAPDDLVRGYVVLFVTAIGFGTLGLFFSALVRRTQAATVLTYAVVLAVTIGSVLAWGFWATMAPGTTNVPVRDDGQVVASTRAPQALLWLNPFVAQADVMCGTDLATGWSCSLIGEIVGRRAVFVDAVPGVTPVPEPAPVDGTIRGDITIPGDTGVARMVVNDVIVQPVDPFAGSRDLFWPRFAAAWLALSVLLVALSVQLVSPSRRWRPHLPDRGRRQSRSAA
jgi:ABC-type transport system involved in multi-copper enzyme maturation permease subunit